MAVQRCVWGSDVRVDDRPAPKVMGLIHPKVTGRRQVWVILSCIPLQQLAHQLSGDQDNLEGSRMAVRLNSGYVAVRLDSSFAPAACCLWHLERFHFGDRAV